MIDFNPIIEEVKLNETTQAMKKAKENSDSLNRLAAKAKRGSKQAKENLLERINRLIIKYIRKYLSDFEHFEDCLQQCRCHLIKTIKQYDSTKPFIPWMTIVVRNCTLNFIRTLNKWRFRSFNIGDEDDEDLSPEANDESVFEILEQKELFSDLHLAIGKLQPHYRRVIEQHYFKRLSCEEIAKLEDAPIGTVKNRLFKARNILRTQLEPLVA